MHDIFVSYRREDATAWAGRLVADLRRSLPNQKVFHDISAIPGGEDFVLAIQNALSSSVVLLVLMGPRWLDVLDERGTPRLHSSDDLVRLEIREALRHPQLKVIPVLFGGARMARAEELPEDLRPLVRRQAHEISESRWDFDVAELVANLRGIANRRGRVLVTGLGRRLGLTVLGVVLLAAIFWYVYLRDRPLDVANLKPGDVFKECKECPEMIVIPSGTFVMGGDPDASGPWRREVLPPHRVTIAQPFAIGKYEVTVGEFTTFVKQTNHKMTPCTYFNQEKFEYVADGGADWSNPRFPQGERHPVVCVGRSDALAYANWLNQILVGKGGSAVYRLPSEAEWEYAARAGTQGATYWAPEQAASDREACGHANLLDESGIPSAIGVRFPCDDGRMYTAPVDDPEFKPNPFGLHHVIGNAEEWVEDCWHESYDGAPADGRAWSRGACARGVLRGAGFQWGMQNVVGSHTRGWRIASSTSIQVGFRVARTLARTGEK